MHKKSVLISALSQKISFYFDTEMYCLICIQMYWNSRGTLRMSQDALKSKEYPDPVGILTRLMQVGMEAP